MDVPSIAMKAPHLSDAPLLLHAFACRTFAENVPQILSFPSRFASPSGVHAPFVLMLLSRTLLLSSIVPISASFMPYGLGLHARHLNQVMSTAIPCCHVGAGRPLHDDFLGSFLGPFVS